MLIYQFSGQERMAGEVCRAFETSGKEPPEQLKKMWEDYKAHMAAEGKTVYIGGCGFSGSGYKYDQVAFEYILVDNMYRCHPSQYAIFFSFFRLKMRKRQRGEKLRA